MTSTTRTTGGVAAADPIAPTDAAHDIVETALADGRFKSLAAVLTACDLVTTLKGPGPFTVFAPTDEAFEQLPKGSIEALRKDVPKLKRVLTYHVIPGRIAAADLARLADKEGRVSAKTVQGQELRLVVAGPTVTVGADAKATVTTADIPATNGIIHVIDHVLMPPT